MPDDGPAEPWFSFLTELDARLDEPADFHCIGGFALSQVYGFAQVTADLDVLSVIPLEAAGWFGLSPFGKGSDFGLSKRTTSPSRNWSAVSSATSVM